MTPLELRFAILAACVLCGQIGWYAAQLAYRPADEPRVELAWHGGVLSVPASDVRRFADGSGIVQFADDHRETFIPATGHPAVVTIPQVIRFDPTP